MTQELMELQDAFDLLKSSEEQGFFIDHNLTFASDVSLANELANRGFRVKNIG